MRNYDLIIVGAGPIGLACAIEAHRNQLNYLVIDKGALVNSLYNYPLYMTFFSTAERLEIGGIPFTNVSSKPGRQEALEYYRNIHNYFQFNLKLYEEVLKVSIVNEDFEVRTSKDKYITQNVVIATGFYDIPIQLGIKGENLPKVTHYFKEAHPYIGQKIVVVGANNSAVDVALETWRKGADVTMVIRGNEIHPRVKYWVKPDIENRIEEGSIKAYFQSNLKEIKEKEVVVSTPEGEITLANDFVLAMIGYRPNFEFLESMGILYSDEKLKIPQYNPTTMESNIPGIFLAGVVCGGLETHKWFIENSRVHAEIIISAIKNKLNN